MKKTIALILIAVMTMALLAGCGNTELEDSESSTTLADNVIEDIDVSDDTEEDMGELGDELLFNDFEKYLNEDMVEVNANYDRIREECTSWTTIPEDETDKLATSVNDVLLPIIYDSLERLESIAPETDEVNAIKAKYVDMMNAYKAGCESISAAFETGDADLLLAGSEQLEDGLAKLDEYNAALDALAAKLGAVIEY